MKLKDIIRKNKQQKTGMPINRELSIVCSNFIIEKDLVLNALISTICVEHNLETKMFSVVPIFDKTSFIIIKWVLVVSIDSESEYDLISETSLFVLKEKLKQLILADEENELYKIFNSEVLDKLRQKNIYNSLEDIED